MSSDRSRGMTELARLVRNRLMLRECHPVFRGRVAAVIAALQARGYRPRIYEAWRSPEAQLQAYESGFSHVTWSFHNATNLDGTPDSLAVDLVDDDHPSHPSVAYCLHLAIEARAHRLQTGIAWDLRTQEERDLVERCIVEHNILPSLEIGFDPCHVEIAGLTLEAARRGERPRAEPS